jgi:hypothetical protein
MAGAPLLPFRSARRAAIPAADAVPNAGRHRPSAIARDRAAGSRAVPGPTAASASPKLQHRTARFT